MRASTLFLIIPSGLELFAYLILQHIDLALFSHAL